MPPRRCYGAGVRRVCFVTGTRAEYGLMRRTLDAIRSTPTLQLQIIATGLHLDVTRGRSVERIREDGHSVDAEVPWPATTTAPALAAATGRATAGIAEALATLDSDIVLVVGDRVEALAAATAGHLSNRIVAHVHGGDRAAGQADDAIRHAVTKLSHLHFPATAESAERLRRLGEDEWRIVQAGSPGLDGIIEDAAPDPTPGDPFALLVLHPTRDDPVAERATAERLLSAVLATTVARVEIVWPNADLGATGITDAWLAAEGDRRVVQHRDLPRRDFLRLMRDAAFMAGNSSSGIIEAASFGTPVLDVGPRQAGRERSGNVAHATDCDEEVAAAVAALFAGRPAPRWEGGNVYGGGEAGVVIARHLAAVELDARLRRKLIAY